MRFINRWMHAIFAFMVLHTYDSVFRLRDIWKVHFLGKLKDYEVTIDNSDERGKGYSKVAIVAIYPNENSAPFTANLIEALKKNGFFVVAVCSRKLNPTEREPFKNFVPLLIERYPVGRDFGSYKVGLQWLEKHRERFPSLHTVVIANDSMYYPARFSEHVSQLLAMDGDWKAIYESWGPVYHAQSYFEVFNQEVFDSDAFKSYWRKYRPYSTRRHAIKRGEIGLSKHLIKKGKFSPPTVLFSSASVYSAITTDLNQSEAGSLSRTVEVGGYDIAMPYSELSGLLTQLSVGLLSNPQPLGSNHQKHKIVETLESLISSEIASRMSELLEEHNPTHILAMAANSTFEAPLKRDLCWRGSFTLGYLINNANGFSDQELRIMEKDIRKRGLPASVRGIGRILWASSRI